ncbi:MAG: hypothetical protein LUO89_10270 [Methanothrix sp.]|nr:hypothetical protein [Methanothrix sp.]
MKQLILIAMMALGLAQGSRAADLVWTPTDANWDLTTSNWKDTNSSSIVPFAQGDNVLFDGTGLGWPDVALGANLLSPNSVVVEVDAPNQYAFASTTGGKLTNVFSLTKRGSGKLILDADNLITNGITIEAGTLQIGNGAGRGALGTGSVTNNGTLAFNRTGTLNFYNNITGTGKLSIPTTGTGTWNLRGTNTLTDYSIEHSGAILYFTNSYSIGNPTNIQFSVSSVNQRLQLGGGVNLPATCPITFTVPFGDINTRASLMSVAGVNSINGPIRIGGGSYGDPNSRPNVNLYGNTAAHVAVTVNSSVEDVPGDPFQGNFILRGNSAAGINKMYGKITLAAAQLLKDEATTWTIYSTGNSATLTWVGGGRLNLAAANALPNAQLTVNATLDLGGFDQKVGPLYSATGTTTGVITNSSTTSDALLTLSDGGDYYGTITDSGSRGKIGLRILNPGAPNTQQLHGLCPYSGPTTLDLATAISLVGSGDIPNTTPIQMANGSSIESRYKNDSTFTLGAAQTLKADGTANIGGNFVSLGTISLSVSKSGGTINADNISIATSYAVTYGGTLNLELSGDPLGSSDEIKLFTADSYASGSAFTTIVPATPGPGRTWNTSTLTTDGTLRIDSTLPTAPTTITTTVVGGGTQLKVEWPTSYTGWALQAQTNAAGVGLTTNWHYVPGSDTTNVLYLPIDPANGSAFFRMVYP